jgi:hypothetical protein
MTVIPAVKTAEFVSDRTSYIVLRVRWCDIVLNTNAPTEDKVMTQKDNSYEELQGVFGQYCMKTVRRI